MKRQRRLLVVENDGYRLAAAVVCASGGGDSAVVEQASVSTATKFDDALDEALGALGKDVPKQAVLLSHEAVPAVIELPVSVDQPRSEDQMRQMVRWEIEPYVAEQATTRPIGTVLVGRGCMTPQQVRQVMAELHRRRQEAAGPSPVSSRPAMFGQVAQEMGLISHEQLTECLAIQERLRGRNAEGPLACGWTGRSGWSTPEGHRWLACGMDDEARQRYVETFKTRGIRLRALYPLIGSAAAALNGEAVGTSCAVLEIQPGVTACTELRNGELEDFRTAYEDNREVGASCAELIDPRDTQAVWVSGRLLDDDGLCERIRGTLGLPVRPIAVSSPSGPSLAAAGSLGAIVGAARHALGLSDATRGVFIPARDPAPPLRRRIGAWWAAGAAAALVLILTVEGLHAWRMSDAQSTLDAGLKKLNEVEARAEKARGSTGQIKKLETQISEQEKKLAAALEHDRWLSLNLVERDRFRKAVLDAVAGAIPPQVAINRVHEQTDHAIEIEAWSLAENAVHEFARRLVDRLRPWRLRITGPSVQRRAGRLNLAGYGMKLRLELVTEAQETR